MRQPSLPSQLDAFLSLTSSGAQALPLIAASVPTVLLVVVGQAHPVLGVHYLEKLQDAARALRVDHLVRFHSSYVPEADLLHLYQARSGALCALHARGRRVMRAALPSQASDVFICAHTTAEQTSSGTMLLAMTSGAAVIATPFAQAAELIDGANGVLVPFNDSTAIARAVCLMPTASTRLYTNWHALTYSLARRRRRWRGSRGWQRQFACRRTQ